MTMTAVPAGLNFCDWKPILELEIFRRNVGKGVDKRYVLRHHQASKQASKRSYNYVASQLFAAIMVDIPVI